MPNATDVSKGEVLKLDGKYWLVLDYTLKTPGNKRGFLQFKLKDLSQGGGVLTKKIGSDDTVDVVLLERRPSEYLYFDGDFYIFMSKETYEQSSIPADSLENVLPYLTDNLEVTVVYLEGTAVSVELPASVELEVTEADPAARGNTATGLTKPATCSTGLVLMVPHFIGPGETIKVDTRTGDFMSRA
ncbi:MAG: elongation factor P [Planctomycetota bacterium]|jgi:elongation factor P